MIKYENKFLWLPKNICGQWFWLKRMWIDTESNAFVIVNKKGNKARGLFNGRYKENKTMRK